MEENNNKKQTVFLSVVAIATLLVAILGATFAWFSARVTGNEEASSVIVETATLGIVYENGNEIRLENAMPGDSDTKTFTVSSEEGANADQKYTLSWDVDTNDFADQTDLVYSIVGTPKGGGTAINVSESQIPAVGKTAIAGEATVKPLETHEYSLTVTFKETGSNQNSNQGKKFYGKIVVDAVQNGSTAD